MKKKKKPKLRPMGEVTSDLEEILLEMYCAHGLQFHEVLGLVHSYTQSHVPSAFEIYDEDGSNPVLYYGPRKKED